jgi:sugar-specific transcriptional regulator TrmB
MLWYNTVRRQSTIVKHNNSHSFFCFKLKGELEMSLERIFKALIDLGLSEFEAQVYMFLETKGAAKARRIAAALQINRTQVYRILKRLQDKKIIKTIVGRPTKFSALPFEEALNLLIQNKKKNAKKAQNNKKELLSEWQIIIKKKSKK